MTYGIFKQVRRIERNEDSSPLNCAPFDVTRYYVTWFGDEPDKRDDKFVEVWGDGSITLNSGVDRLFLYEDQWLGVITALQQAMEDKKIARRERAAAWLVENGDKREHYGYSVDLSINETRSALSGAVFRVGDDGRVEVNYIGAWLHLCRTDLKDDVCTYYGTDCKDVPATLLRYQKSIQFGARVNGERFAVVDAFSDG